MTLGLPLVLHLRNFVCVTLGARGEFSVWAGLGVRGGPQLGGWREGAGWPRLGKPQFLCHYPPPPPPRCPRASPHGCLWREEERGGGRGSNLRVTDSKLSSQWKFGVTGHLSKLLRQMGWSQPCQLALRERGRGKITGSPSTEKGFPT